MASIIKADNIQKVSDGSNIIKKCGSTITLGSCGATIVTLACGATQTGFGRTGTVDWCTTAKTAPFTGVSGNGYFVNTTSGVVTVTLPATPTAGDIISIADYASTWDTNAVTLCRNGSLINGACNNTSLNTKGQSITLVYVDATRGWKNTMDSTSNITGAPTYIVATGGTITCCGDYKIHTFTSDGCFSVSSAPTPANNVVDYLVVAGGGGNGVGSGGGAGGGGGARMSSGVASGCYTASPLGSCVSALPVSITTYPITVGGGGTGATSTSIPSATGNGSNSVFSTITSAGGGGGGSENPSSSIKDGASGGSGGAGSYVAGNVGGTGNTPPTSPAQGNPGGNGISGPIGIGGGGGGGAGCAGPPSPGPGSAGPGGNGISNSITGSATYYAGGGGGGSQTTPGSPPTTGGLGGGGKGSAREFGPPVCAPVSIGTAGTANTGGGAGGGWSWAVSPSTAPLNGGSGVIIIRYKYQ
jgi:hypothetical protein